MGSHASAQPSAKKPKRQRQTHVFMIRMNREQHQQFIKRCHDAFDNRGLSANYYVLTELGLASPEDAPVGRPRGRKLRPTAK